MTAPPFRRLRWLPTLAALAAVGYFAATTPRFWPGPWSTAPEPSLRFVERNGEIFGESARPLRSVKVLRALDGDTILVSWRGQAVRLRYYGIDTPESGEPCYREAVDRNKVLAGETVFLGFDERPKDKYDRLLAYVFAADMRSIDAAMVSEGLARAWGRDGRFKSELLAAEDKARKGASGCLWGTAAARNYKKHRHAWWDKNKRGKKA